MRLINAGALRTWLGIIADCASIVSTAAILLVCLTLIRYSPRGLPASKVEGPERSRRTVTRVDPVRTKANETTLAVGAPGVAIVEFSDYECPFCIRFANRVFPQLRREYIDTGRLAYVVRDLPLSSIHPRAYRASQAAECARGQGLFWEAREMLFRNGPLALEQQESLGAIRGLDPVSLQRCLKPQTAGKVDADIAEAKRLGIAQTPTFLVGRVDADGAIVATTKIVGSDSMAEFRAAIDSYVSQAGPR